MFKAYKYRIYPTTEQVYLINQHIGSARFIYNLALETKTVVYKQYKKSLSRIDLQNQLPELKKECEWLKQINSQTLQASIANLETAFVSFLHGRGGYPTFKKKLNKGSFQCPQNVDFDFKNSTMWLPKFKSAIKTVYDRRFVGNVKSTTISKTSSGKFFASVLVQTEHIDKKEEMLCDDKVVGIDLGIKDFAIMSDGQKVDSPKFLRNNLTRLKVLQRRASKKVKGSANRKKANLRVAILHERIANQRKDFLHKLSTTLIKNHDAVVIEDLAVANMVKNHKLAQAISDVSWSEFRRQLTYKAEWYGKHVIVIGRFEPSTKTCSSCGYINQQLTLKDREWECPACLSEHDRDINAAINIKDFGLLKHHSGYGLKNKSGRESSVEPVETLTLVRSMKQEKFS